eukprot:884251-Ditylum_brightwellii.AAC.1
MKCGVVDPEDIIFQNGTKDSPFITFVDANFPERNDGTHGCDITYVSAIEHNNSTHDAYKIRLK